MIETLNVRQFKSLESVEVHLGHINVFIGANGSGKSNLLEAMGVLSAAADGKVTDQSLLQWGVRLAFPPCTSHPFGSRLASRSRVLSTFSLARWVAMRVMQST